MKEKLTSRKFWLACAASLGSLKDALIANALFGGGGSPAPEPVELPVTWVTAGATTQMITQRIDARLRDVHITIPFVPADLNEGATIDASQFGICADYYEDAEGGLSVGPWYNGDWQDGWSGTRNELIKCEQEWVAPKGDYIRIIIFKRNAQVANNSAFQQYLAKNVTSVTLI